MWLVRLARTRRHKSPRAFPRPLLVSTARHGTVRHAFLGAGMMASGRHDQGRMIASTWSLQAGSSAARRLLRDAPCRERHLQPAQGIGASRHRRGREARRRGRARGQAVRRGRRARRGQARAWRSSRRSARVAAGVPLAAIEARLPVGEHRRARDALTRRASSASARPRSRSAARRATADRPPPPASAARERRRRDGRQDADLDAVRGSRGSGPGPSSVPRRSPTARSRGP